MPQLALGLLSAFFVVAWGGAAGASPIGPSCGTCQGSIYDLTYSGSPIATTATTETFRITYSIDTSGYSGLGSNLNTVALKVAASFVDATLVTAPGGVANWVEMFGGLNAAGCSGSGSGYDCVRVVAMSSAPLVPGLTYTWVFDVTVPTGTLFTGVGQSSVKARYGNGFTAKVGDLVSEGITLTVPEPSSTLLLGAAAGTRLLARMKPARLDRASGKGSAVRPRRRAGRILGSAPPLYVEPGSDGAELERIT